MPNDRGTVHAGTIAHPEILAMTGQIASIPSYRPTKAGRCGAAMTEKRGTAMHGERPALYPIVPVLTCLPGASPLPPKASTPQPYLIPYYERYLAQSCRLAVLLDDLPVLRRPLQFQERRSGETRMATSIRERHGILG